jgi:hypothetical protein
MNTSITRSYQSIQKLHKSQTLIGDLNARLNLIQEGGFAKLFLQPLIPSVVDNGQQLVTRWPIAMALAARDISEIVSLIFIIAQGYFP